MDYLLNWITGDIIVNRKEVLNLIINGLPSKLRKN